MVELAERLRDLVYVDEIKDIESDKDASALALHPFVFLRTSAGIVPIKTSFWLAQRHRGEPFELELKESQPVQPIPYAQLTSHVLEILAQELTLVQDEDTTRYLVREDYLLHIVSQEQSGETTWLRNLFSSIPRGLLVVDLNYVIVNHNKEALRMLRIDDKDVRRTKIYDLFNIQHFQYVQQTHEPLLNQVVTATSSQAPILVDFVPLVTKGVMTGFALVLQDLPSVEEMAMELDLVKQLNQDLETIFSTIYDEIIVVDSDGHLLRASEHYISVQWNDPPQDLIGKSLLKGKASKGLRSQVIREVQKKQQKVSVLQNVGDAQIVAVGNPIFTSKGRLDRIVIASRDLTEVSRLQRELEQTKAESETYRRELRRLRDRITQAQGTVPVYTSNAMHEVMKEAERVARFSATVLITGESGVGKEIIASAIHSFSDRRDGPFVKINCAAIPESLLESELFGYEKGAFSGAKQDGKKGLFVKAHKGTLFLDEISELPLGIQSKLLRAIQEREVYPVGATVPLKFDVQLIAAANRRLSQLVEQGSFREDLFYRINVFPIDVPPLRERREDIGVLAHHFLFQFNQTYQRDLHFSGSAIELLEAYSFPGNVRELQNIVQRVAIKSDSDIIHAQAVEHVLVSTGLVETKTRQLFSQVVPLKQAFLQVERELITLAMKQYRSTTKAAQALGISQSSVSRKARQLDPTADLDDVTR